MRDGWGTGFVVAVVRKTKAEADPYWLTTRKTDDRFGFIVR
jgi:hypothetical protein